jgi:hypothetical protein
LTGAASFAELNHPGRSFAVGGGVVDDANDPNQLPNGVRGGEFALLFADYD